MNYKLYYWPVPFRGNFIRILLEEGGASYIEATSDEIIELKTLSPAAHPFPFMAPPYLQDPDGDIFLSQMPVIVMYLAKKLGYLPEDPFQSAVCLKLVLDSNDVLAEITNLNGSMMWERSQWEPFRKNRLKRWLEIFEQSGRRLGLTSKGSYMLGTDQITVADLVTYALWGTMMRCLPDLSEDIQKHAPYISGLCRRIENRPRIQKFVGKQAETYGELYCGGQIEKSIRSMLEADRR